MHKITPWIASLIRKPTLPVNDPQPLKRSDWPPALPLPQKRNSDTMPTGIRVGDVHFSYYEETKDFYTLALYNSPEWILTPGYMNACALYQAIKVGVIERQPHLVGEDFEHRVRAVGADWSYLRMLEVGEKRKLWIAKGDITLHGDPARLTQLFTDLTAATQQAGLNPDQYFALPH